MSKRPRGTGTVYQQYRKLPNGERKLLSKFWWIGYRLNGEYKRESSGSTKKIDAQNLLKRRLGEIQQGDFLGPEIERILVSELADALLADYRINGKAEKWAERCWKKHLEPFFGHTRAAQVSTDLLNRYIEQRRDEKAANATINRELSILQRMFSLAYHSHPRKVARPLTIRRLAENRPRSGFVEEADYGKLREKAGKTWLRGMLACAYSFGFRKSELLGMRVRQVDLLGRTLRLDPGTTKNDEGRTVVMTDEVYALLCECVRGKQAEEYVFTRRSGQPVADFREAWAKLTKAAGLDGLLFHDLRRSAVRNMVRRGIPERVAMAISGHKTRSVFDRYNIVSESDLAEAARRIEGSMHSQVIAGAETGTDDGKEFARKPS